MPAETGELLVEGSVALQVAAGDVVEAATEHGPQECQGIGEERVLQHSRVRQG